MLRSEGILVGYPGNEVERSTVSDAEAIELIETARIQLEDYLRLAALGAGPMVASTVTAMPVYSWDNPLSVTLSAAPHAVVVQSRTGS
jgi:hypothetical protein